MKKGIKSGSRKKVRVIEKMKANQRIYYQKGVAVTVSLILLFTALISLTLFLPTASAQTQIPSYYGWSGYNGNYTIYMSNSTSLGANPHALPSKDTQDYQGPNTQLGTGPNGIVLSTSAINTAAGSDPFNEQYNSQEKQLVVTIPTIIGSGTNQTRFDDQNTGAYNVYGVAMQNLSISASGLSSITLNSLYTDSSALNLSIPNGILGGSGISNVELAILNQSLLDAVTLLGPDVLGYAIPYINLALLATEYGATSKVILGGNGFNSMTAQNLTVNPNTGNYTKWVNETGTNSGYDFQYGENVLAGEMIDQLNINSADFAKTGYVNISGVNYLGEYSYPIGWTVFAPKGATASISVPAVPAYTITGNAYINGQLAKNTELLLESPTANYYIWTDENGSYRFFGQPGVNYFLTDPSAISIGGVQIDPSSTDVSGGNYNLYATTLTFSESGLSGASWSVQLKGPLLPSGNQEQYTTPSTSSSSISIQIAGNEEYQYFIGVPSGYTVSSSSGFINVGTGPQTFSVSFTKTPTYTVTFQESGLPGGTQWSAKLDGNQKSSTSSSISFYSVSAGSHSYSIPYVYYSTTLWYEPTTGSGSFTLSSSKTVSASFIAVQQNPLSCVAADAPVLLSNYSTALAQDITTGEGIMTYNLSTQTFEPGTAEGVFVTQHSSMYVINGYLNVAGDQDIWTDHGYIQAQNLTGNDMIFDVFNHHFYKVHSIVVEHGNYTMYDFFVSGDHNYVVWSNLMQDRLP